MIIDWTALVERLGSLRPDGESGGTDYAKRALEDIPGDENIASGVELILSYGRGAEVAMNVLTHITSRKALMLAYAAYQRAAESPRRVANQAP